MKSLTGVIKDYDWGSTEHIPAILGTKDNGHPQAEYWLGAHLGGPASIDDTTLDKVIAANPSIIGDAALSTYGPRLPFLLKILSADQPLSLQAHPNSEQAQTGFLAEEASGVPIDDPTRTFKDTWHKPELLVALSTFDAVAGFRDPAETVRLFNELELPLETNDELLAPLKNRVGSAALAQVFLDTLRLDESRHYLVDEVVAAALKHVNEDSPLGVFSRTAVLLDNYHPGDPGIIAALLMNRLQLTPGDALQIMPGTLHAYLEGTGIEIMASSDNVLRGGLTTKHIDVDALVDVLDFTPAPPMIVHTLPADEAGFARYDENIDEFSLWRLDLVPEKPGVLPEEDSGRILLTIDGHLTCRNSSGEELELVQGGSCFIAANEHVQVEGDCFAFLATAGKPND